MFRNIADTFANCFKVPELKSRILFTLGILIVVRLTAFVRVPGLDGTALSNYINTHAQGGAMGMVNMFNGGATGNCGHRRHRHHALHQRDDHHPIAHGGLAEIKQARGAKKAVAQNCPIRTLPDRAALFRLGLRDGHHLGKSGKSFRIGFYRPAYCFFACQIIFGGIASRRL